MEEGQRITVRSMVLRQGGINVWNILWGILRKLNEMLHFWQGKRIFMRNIKWTD